MRNLLFRNALRPNYVDHRSYGRYKRSFDIISYSFINVNENIKTCINDLWAFIHVKVALKQLVLSVLKGVPLETMRPTYYDPLFTPLKTLQNRPESRLNFA